MRVAWWIISFWWSWSCCCAESECAYEASFDEGTGDGEAVGAGVDGVGAVVVSVKVVGRLGSIVVGEVRVRDGLRGWRWG